MSNESQDNNERKWCEMLMIAHDVNFNFVFHVGTGVCEHSFSDNWNSDLNHATGFIYDIDISGEQFCL